MDDRYLATGFAGLDRLDDVSVFADCLRLLETLPDMRAIKDESLGWLDLSPDDRVLEAGCGLGAEARRLAGLVGPTGGVVGLDASRAILGRAAATEGPSVSWVQADAVKLPFADGVFAACRVERMLQHVDDPGAVVAELARVVRPGGTVVALEPDWGMFVVDSSLREIQRVLAGLWCDSFRNGWVGRRLARHLATAGLEEVAVRPRTLVVRRLGQADAIFDLFATLDRAVAAGHVTTAQARSFRDEQKQADAAGFFCCALTFFLVRGVRPGGAP